MKEEEKITMRAIALCHKPWLKPEEAYIYTNLERTRFLIRCEEFGIYKSSTGYYSREELDKMMSGNAPTVSERLRKLRFKL